MAPGLVELVLALAQTLPGLPDHPRRELQDQREVGKDLPVPQTGLQPFAELPADVPRVGVDQRAEAYRRLGDNVGSDG